MTDMPLEVIPQKIPRPLVLQTLQEIDRFVDIMADPERQGLSVQAIADTFQMSIKTLYNKANSKEIARAIEQRRIELMKVELPGVDKAMLKAAQGGNVKAAQLVYERWDNYKPKAKVEIQTNTQFNIKQANGEK